MCSYRQAIWRAVFPCIVSLERKSIYELYFENNSSNISYRLCSIIRKRGDLPSEFLRFSCYFANNSSDIIF